MVGGVLNTGLAGLQRSSSEINKSAQEIASFPVTQQAAEAGGNSFAGNGTLAEPIVNMKFEQLIFEASAKVISTADETLGTLIDIKS